MFATPKLNVLMPRFMDTRSMMRDVFAPVVLLLAVHRAGMGQVLRCSHFAVMK